VTGIGPKLGLSVLSDLTVNEVVNAVRGDDFQTFTRVSGIGKKTAQRLVLELANAFDDLPVHLDLAPNVVAHSGGDTPVDDLRSALLNLEYKPAAIEQVIGQLGPFDPDDDDFQSLLRRALKLMRG
jgi:holliday junction DNA helicase RuvA